MVSWPFVLALGGAAVAAGTGVAVGWAKARFLARTPALVRRADLNALKRLAGREVVTALAGLASFLISIAGMITAGFLGWMTPREFLGAFAAWGPVAAVIYWWHKSADDAIEAMPVSGRLRQERDEVIRVVTSRPLPPWGWLTAGGNTGDDEADDDPVLIDDPPFGRLTWDRGWWWGAAALPAWAGFRDRSGPPGGAARTGPTAGLVQPRC